MVIIVFCYVVGCLVAMLRLDEMFCSCKSSSSVNFYGLQEFDKAKVILLNNSIVAIRYFILGVFTFGVASLFYSLYNGLVFGAVLTKGIAFLNYKELIVCTIPHAITENCGLFLAGFVGFSLSQYIFMARQLLTPKVLLYLTVISVVLIVLSSFVESYVSMSI